MKNFIVISPEPWSKSKVSKHHYAFELSKRDNNVFFLNPNTNSFHCRKESENLFIVDYEEPIRGVGYFPRLIQATYTKFLLKFLEIKLNVKFDVIWNFDSSRFYELSMIKGVLKICHIVDMNQNFNRDQLARTSDICLCTSDFILKELKKSNDRSYKINHGYQNVLNSNVKFNYDFEGQKKLKCLYLGNIGIKCLDWDLIKSMSEQNSNVDFHFIGPNSAPMEDNDNKKEVKKKSNVYFLPPIEANQIPSVLENADVLLVAYDTNNYLKQVSNPHKIMEYLGSGQVVVATYIDEYKNTSGILEMGESKEDVLKIFKDVVSNLELFNSVDSKQKRKDFALNNTYAKQVDRIEQLIHDMKA